MPERLSCRGKKKKCFWSHSPKNCYCALSYQPAERHIVKDIKLVKKLFSAKTLLVCCGSVWVWVCVLWWWGGWLGGDKHYVFTNRAAGIFAAMATNHMTRCIRLPWTGCSEAWCEHSLCCSAPLKVLSLSYLSFSARRPYAYTHICTCRHTFLISTVPCTTFNLQIYLESYM